ncbi:uncharacterized protein DS421_13g405280 [Arachis hypogaea]|nr:uncharacterized protein DS421_13g405280 [Arachis hypogaea]
MKRKFEKRRNETRKEREGIYKYARDTMVKTGQSLIKTHRYQDHQSLRTSLTDATLD